MSIRDRDAEGSFGAHGNGLRRVAGRPLVAVKCSGIQGNVAAWAEGKWAADLRRRSCTLIDQCRSLAGAAKFIRDYNRVYPCRVSRYGLSGIAIRPQEAGVRARIKDCSGIRTYEELTGDLRYDGWILGSLYGGLPGATKFIGNRDTKGAALVDRYRLGGIAGRPQEPVVLPGIEGCGSAGTDEKLARDLRHKLRPFGDGNGGLPGTPFRVGNRDRNGAFRIHGYGLCKTTG